MFQAYFMMIGDRHAMFLGLGFTIFDIFAMAEFVYDVLILAVQFIVICIFLCSHIATDTSLFHAKLVYTLILSLTD